MKFEYFISASKSLAMVISIEEYESIKPLIKEFYTEEQLNAIDEYGKFKPSTDKFLLCNPHKTKEIITPMMHLNAVTFVDRVPFKEIEFKEVNMKFRTVGQLKNYIRENFYTTDFKENHTRKQFGYMLNMLYPFQKKQFPYSRPFSTMCKGRAMKHIEFYIQLHKLRCKF